MSMKSITSVKEKLKLFDREVDLEMNMGRYLSWLPRYSVVVAVEVHGL